MCYFRRDIYEFLLHTDFDKDYFDTTIFFEKHKIQDNNLKKEMIKKVIQELKQLGLIHQKNLWPTHLQWDNA